MVAKVLSNVRGLSGAWLLAGKRPMFTPEPSEGEAAALRDAGQVAADLEESEVRLRVIGRIASTRDVDLTTLRTIDAMTRHPLSTREVGDAIADWLRRASGE